MDNTATPGTIQIFISQPVGPRGAWRVWEGGRLLAEQATRDAALVLAKNRSTAARRMNQLAEIRLEAADGSWDIIAGS